MHFLGMDLFLLLQLVAFAVGCAYVVTGSIIGYPARVVGYGAFHRIPVARHLVKIYFCPPCCSWWAGAVLGLWAGLPWFNVLQVAFTACLFGIITQQQWEVAANDEAEIAKIFRRE